MQRTRKTCILAYRLHKPSGQAVVTIRGRDRYLGQYGSGPSRSEYDRLNAEYLVNQSTGHATGKDASDLTIAELCSRYDDHSCQYHVKHGRPTSEIHTIRRAVRTLLSLYAHTVARDYGPLAVKTCRQQWIDEGVTRRGVNRLAQTVRAIFRWGAENELVPITTWQALTAVSGLKRGRTLAPEPQPVKPVAEDVLAKTLEAAHPVIRVMILVQLKTGMRPGELVQLRGADLDTSGPVWIFKPFSHKLEHQGRERIIFIGPDAQAKLKPWLPDDPAQFVFGPRQDERGAPAHCIAPRESSGCLAVECEARDDRAVGIENELDRPMFRGAGVGASARGKPLGLLIVNGAVREMMSGTRLQVVELDHERSSCIMQA
jgi:integrase